MKPITVVVTASGAPGTAALLHALRENGEREVRLVGTDMSERVGRPPPLRRVPPRPGRLGPGVRRGDPRRWPSARAPWRSCPSRPSTSRGSPARATLFDDIAVLVSSPEAIHRSNDKAETYAFLRRLGLPAPDFRRVQRRRGGRARPPRSSATRNARSASSRCSLPARAASGSSTRPSTAPTSSCASGPGSVSMLLEDAVEILASVDDQDGAARDGARRRARADDRRDRERPGDRARPSEDPRGDARRARDVLRHARGRRVDGARERDRRRARHRALLQHPARRRPRDRDQPADLDDRLPGRSEPPLPRRQARDRRDLRRGAPGAAGHGSRPGRTALRYFDQLEWDA